MPVPDVYQDEAMRQLAKYEAKKMHTGLPLKNHSAAAKRNYLSQTQTPTNWNNHNASVDAENHFLSPS